MKPVRFNADPAKVRAAYIQRFSPAKLFADTSFDFGFNVTKKKSKGKGTGKKKKAPAGGGS